MRSVLFCLVLSMMVAITAVANDYYVSPSGSDSNDGSQAHPWATINHAESALTLGANGATVHVAPGTYNGNVSLTRSGSSTSGRITFVSDTKYGAKITAASGSIVSVTGSWNDVQDFEIAGTTGTNFGILFYGTNNRAIGNKIHDIYGPTGCLNSGAAGIDGQNSSSNSSAIGNLLYNINVTGSCVNNIGIYLGSPYGIIENNIVAGGPNAMAIETWHAATNMVISNNTVFGNGHFNGTGYVGGGILIGCGDSGCTTGVNNTSVVNNIIYANGGIGLRELGTVGSASNRYANNIVNGNGVDFKWQSGSCASCLNVSPQFVNYRADGSGDYHLAAGSPAMNAGVTGISASTGCAAAGIMPCVSTTDFDGSARVVVDLGALETVTSAVLPAAPTGLTATVQ